MANTPGSKKRIRRNDRRADINRGRRSRVRTYIRSVDEAIGAGDQDAARAAFKTAEPEIMRAAGKGLLHRNTAARRVSRLARRVKGMSH